jgi:murein DD-endopeptidase MepM/ murein hydrolase activator NlpD
LYQFSHFEADAAAPLRFGVPGDRPRIGRGFGSRGQSGPMAVRRPGVAAGLDARFGSGRWLRGAASLSLLCCAAWTLAPGLETIPVASASPLGASEAREAAALAIAPLAYGGDTGRRMPPGDAVESLLDSPERPTLTLVAMLGQGDGLVRALERSGVAGADAARVAALVAQVVPLDQIRAGTAMTVTLGRRTDAAAARPLDGLAFRARLDLALSLARGPAGLILRRTPIAIDSTPLRIQGPVGDSLYRSARAAGVPAKAVEAYIRAIATQDGLDDLGADDRFDIVLERRRAATGESETGRLLYAGLTRTAGKDLQLMPWPQGGTTQWFEASGVGKQRGGLIQPVPGGVSSSFGMRFHPLLHYFRMHRGMDFRAAYGTPILAVTDGRVAAAGWAGGYGNQVRLGHGGGLVTSYSHMSRIAVEPGALVRQGEVIGYVGSTGLSTGPHLHYEVYRHGAPIDPAGLRFAVRAQLDGPALAAFRERLRSLLALPVGQAASPRFARAGASPKASEG